MEYIINPVLPGFHPDPSILRVGGDYYLATSTFEWFPGVEIHHSKDLINWRLIARPLQRILYQLDMSGNPSSGGVWAPCLSYDQGIFYLIYTDVKTRSGAFKDTHNYLVTTDNIRGDWSDPTYLNSSGFDPSLFHDSDGKKYLLNQIWDYRLDRNSFGGILLQEFSPQQQRLVGEIYNIFRGTDLGRTEGPHLCKHNDLYYLMTAEGGTGYTHAVTMARSTQITGPYEVDPQNPLLTSAMDPNLTLQKSGHASLVETINGQWYIAHLCARPLPGTKRCVLGRETAIQEVVWSDDGWLRLASGGKHPQVKVPAPRGEIHPWPKPPPKDDFDSFGLRLEWQSLRIPITDDWLCLITRPGYLRLFGRESLSSKHDQSLIARRQESFCYTASTCLEFEPDTFQQMAGLICLYDTQNFYYLYISHDEEKGKILSILSCQNNSFAAPLEPVELGGTRSCFLRVSVNFAKLQFYYSLDNVKWHLLGPVFDASTLSDEYCQEGNFTGAFVGLCCQDLSGRRKPADFDFFEYLENSCP